MTAFSFHIITLFCNGTTACCVRNNIYNAEGTMVWDSGYKSLAVDNLEVDAYILLRYKSIQGPR